MNPRNVRDSDQLVISARGAGLSVDNTNTRDGATGAGAIPKGEIAHVAHLSPELAPASEGFFTAEL
ncbi:MAG: hypothetical protein BroJett039_04620 [Chloroflexota bacterium]|nr:MAG: hypothetical protein BroJett039_04620 [Chloroflexota bacterium]